MAENKKGEEKTRGGSEEESKDDKSRVKEKRETYSETE